MTRQETAGDKRFTARDKAVTTRNKTVAVGDKTVSVRVKAGAARDKTVTTHFLTTYTRSAWQASWRTVSTRAWIVGAHTIGQSNRSGIYLTECIN